jgi:hypothetical protein
MSARVLNVRCSAENVRRIVEQVVSEVVHASTSFGVRVLEDAAKEVATQIRREYVVKAYGGIDDADISWKKSKAAQDRGGLTLIETGSLIESLAGDVVRGAMAELRVMATNKGNLKRDPTQYAGYVFKGTKNEDGSVKLPARPAWPADGTIPDSYVRAAQAAILPGIHDEIVRRLLAA